MSPEYWSQENGKVLVPLSFLQKKKKKSKAQVSKDIFFLFTVSLDNIRWNSLKCSSRYF